MATINVKFRTEKKEYPPSFVVGVYRCELLDKNQSQVIAKSEDTAQVVTLLADPGEFFVRTCRLDEGGNPLQDSVVVTGPYTVNQLVDVPVSQSVTVSIS